VLGLEEDHDSGDTAAHHFPLRWWLKARVPQRAYAHWTMNQKHNQSKFNQLSGFIEDANGPLAPYLQHS
jgi:hypothetical protein